MIEDGTDGSLETDYRFYSTLLGSHGQVRVGRSQTGVKIFVYDERDVVYFARLLRFLPVAPDIQVHFSGTCFDKDWEEIGQQREGYCVADGVFHADNELTAGMLADDYILNLFGFYPVEMVEHDILPQVAPVYELGDPVSVSVEEQWDETQIAFIEPLPEPEPDPGGDPGGPGPDPEDACGGNKCTDCNKPVTKCKKGTFPYTYLLKPTKKDGKEVIGECLKKLRDGRSRDKVIAELCKYRYFSLKKLGKGKVYCFEPSDKTVGTDKEKKCREKRAKCLAAWRALLSGLGCQAPNGGANGHTPDTCAGGNPGVGACILDQTKACNGSLGGKCGTKKNDCYNDIKFAYIDKDGKKVDIVCPQEKAAPKNATAADKKVWEDLKKKWDEEATKTKARVTKKLCAAIEKQGKTKFKDWPAYLKDYFCICAGGKVPSKTTAPAQ